jgi:dipeptidase E
MTKNLLLISNSTNAGENYLSWPKPYLANFLRKFSVRTVLFVPYAGVNLSSEGITASYDAYVTKVRPVFEEMGIGLESVHQAQDPRIAVKKAECIVVGGGNTFHLVKAMYDTGIMGMTGDRAAQGIPFIGWSAGANVACPTMKTTNDMPISEPYSFNTLGLVPFQINPHYLDANPSGHAGETREQRIMEFLAVNRKTTVVGLREGCLLWIEGHSIEMKGHRPLRVFRYGIQPQEFQEGDPIDFLLEEPSK